MGAKNQNKTDYGQKIKISVILTLTIILSAVYFVILPTAASIQKIKNSIETRRLDLDRNYFKGRTLKKMVENLKKVEPELAKLENIFIKNDEALGFVTTLEGMADAVPVEQRINLGAAQNGTSKFFEKIPLQINTSASFEKQLKYLVSLETIDYYINVKSLEVTNSGVRTVKTEDGQEISENNVTVQVLADTYWLKKQNGAQAK